MSAGWIVLARAVMGSISTNYPKKCRVEKPEGLSKA